jgi:PPOX class probable F420-dependent enzyme
MGGPAPRSGRATRHSRGPQERPMRRRSDFERSSFSSDPDGRVMRRSSSRNYQRVALESTRRFRPWPRRPRPGNQTRAGERLAVLRLPLPPEVDEFLRRPNPAVVATLRPDGSPHTVATWYDWDGARVLLNMDESRLRLRFMRRDPRVALTALGVDSWYSHVSLVGRIVSIEDDPELRDIDRLAALHRPGVPLAGRAPRERLARARPLARLELRLPYWIRVDDTAREAAIATAPGRGAPGRSGRRSVRPRARAGRAREPRADRRDAAAAEQHRLVGLVRAAVAQPEERAIAFS